jgi:porphyrinogen peroxidase
MSNLADSFHDIPALVGSGFMDLRQGRFLLIHVQNHAQCAARARRWLADVIEAGLVKCLGDVRAEDDAESPRAKAPSSRSPIRECVTIAISHAGLLALGLQEDPDRPFPSAFRAGMSHPVRRRLLRDADEHGALDPWEWGDMGPDESSPVHLLVAHYWAEGHTPATLLDAASLANAGLGVRVVETCPGAIRHDPQGRLAMYEPFGFQDGAGQPRLRGIAPSGRHARGTPERPVRTADDRRVWAGEFVLGQRNEYHELSYCPSVIGWPISNEMPQHFGTNGSYLAARQIHQYVEVFKQFVANCFVERLGSKMIGRRMNAWPMVDGPLPAGEQDDFRYLAGDAPGFECPRGAHIRRANPRDALAHDVAEGIESSRLHRLLRRGRVYADKPRTTSSGDGLMFLALNADLDRQFEFVQGNWIMGSRFGDLSDEQDPILGVRPDRMFTVPGCPVGQRVGPLPRFTRVRGGGYFFLPGLQAMRFIVGLAPAVRGK